VGDVHRQPGYNMSSVHHHIPYTESTAK